MSRKTLVGVAVVFWGLVTAGCPSWAESPRGAGTAGLSQVRTVVLYENITDGVAIGRNVTDTVKMLKEMRADMIFRGFWKWEPVVESPDDIPVGLVEFAQGRGLGRQQAAVKIRRSGRYYRSLASWIAAIKQELPSLIFCGAVPAQQLCRVELNPKTGKVYSSDETWGMALDPQKWQIIRKGKPVTKEQLQARFAGKRWGENGVGYDRRKAAAYFPDITNADFQALLLSWAEKQIDCGADAIWVDMLYAQSKLIYQATGDAGHPAVRESLAAASKIIDEIHQYGQSKGKYIYVGTWGQGTEGPGEAFAPSGVDFVTFTPSQGEIRDNALDQKKWKGKVLGVRQHYGDIPMFAFIDWSNNDSPTVIFSQELDTDEQSHVLKVFDESFERLGINLIYPLHGGYMGKSAGRLSFGKYRVYDSLAPEFGTYPTIRELARKKGRLK